MNHFSFSDAQLISGTQKNQRATVGKSKVEFQCSLRDSGSGEFSWTGPALADGDSSRVRSVSRQFSSKLEINDVNVMDAGVYTCSHGSASLSFNLTVWGELSFSHL